MTARTTAQPRLTDEEYQARFEQEVAAYAAMHRQLMEKYGGQWVAIYGGQVIDVDVDDVALFDRVIDQYGEDAPILFHKVTGHVFNVLIGRDLLNQLTITLDGPHLRVEIDDA